MRLTADDVAAAAWKVVHERRRIFAGPHRPVGRQTRLMAAASAVTPDWANRLVVSRLARVTAQPAYGAPSGSTVS